MALVAFLISLFTANFLQAPGCSDIKAFDPDKSQAIITMYTKYHKGNISSTQYAKHLISCPHSQTLQKHKQTQTTRPTNKHKHQQEQ